MARARYSFAAGLWEHDAQGTWHFVSLPADVADDIEHRLGMHGLGEISGH